MDYISDAVDTHLAATAAEADAAETTAQLRKKAPQAPESQLPEDFNSDDPNDSSNAQEDDSHGFQFVRF